jgi:hypothetical protein
VKKQAVNKNINDFISQKKGGIYYAISDRLRLCGIAGN